MEQAAEAAAAAAGGMFSACALFPLEVIKTNLQAHTKQKDAAEGGTAVATSGGDATANNVGETGTAEEQQYLTGVQSGGIGIGREGGEDKDGATGQGTKYAPMNEAPCVTSVAKGIYTREGLLGFYNGVLYASGQSAVEKAAYFYGYGWLKALALRGGRGGELNSVTDLGLGYLAEAFHLPFTIPVEVVLTKIMTSKDKTNAFAVIQGILAESGPAGFYKGVQAYVILCLKPAIQYAAFNRLKAITLAYKSSARGSSGERELTAVQAFVLGAISRAVATIIVFPYIRAKVIIMSRKSGAGGSDKKAPSILNSLVTIFKDEGVSALFQGITPEITRGVLSAAFMLMVKEKIHAIVKGAIIGPKA